MYMKNLFQDIRSELLYELYSKKIFILLLIVFGLSFINLMSLNKNISTNYELFKKTTNEYIEQNINIEEELKKEANIVELENGGNIIKNVIRYDYDNLVKSIESLHPSRIVNSTLSYLTFIYIPIIFGIYGILIASYDRKYKTWKIKAILNNIKTKIIAKQISLIFITILSIMISLLGIYIVSIFMYKNISNNNQFIQFIQENISYDIGSIVLQILFSTLIAILFSNIGFFMGVISNSSLFPSILLMIYSLLIPNLGVYDLKNIIINTGSRLFQFNGMFQLANSVGTISYSQYLFWILISIIIIALPSFVGSKRSRYV